MSIGTALITERTNLMYLLLILLNQPLYKRAHLAQILMQQDININTISRRSISADYEPEAGLDGIVERKKFCMASMNY